VIPQPAMMKRPGTPAAAAGRGGGYSIATWEMGLCVMLLSSFVLSVCQQSNPLTVIFTDWKWYVFLIVTGFGFIQSYSLRGWFSDRVGICFLLFVVAATVSSIIAQGDIVEGLQRSISFWCLYLLATIFVIPHNPLRRIVVWTKATLLVCLAVVGISLVYGLLGRGFPAGRFAGLTANANTLGSISAMSMAGCFGQWIVHRGKKNAAYWLAAVLLAAPCLLLTQSRSALAAGAAGILAVLAIKRKWFKTAAILVVATLFLAALQESGMFSLGSISGREIKVRSYTLSSRFHQWTAQFDAWKRKPLLGNGLQITGLEGTGRTGGESSYIDVLGAAGILGGVPLFLGLLWGTRALVHLGRRFDERQDKGFFVGYYVSALGMVAAVLVNSIGEGFMAAVGAMQPIYVWIVLAAAGQSVRTLSLATILEAKRTTCSKC